MRCLVLRGGALGDFVVSLPALRHLHAGGKNAIELVGNAPAAQLALQAGLVERVHSQHEARWAELYGEGPVSREVATFLARFDLVVSFWPDPDGILARQLTSSGRQVVFGAALPASAPAALHYLEVARRATGLPPNDAEGLDFRLRFETPRGRTIAVHPGSGSARKNWPIERWSELCQRIEAPMLIVGGVADAERVEQLRRFGEVLFDAPVVELARRLAGCRLFVGHDSGVSHVAAAVGTPSVLLFGPTDPAVWAPPGPHVTVVKRGDTLDRIALDEVLKAIEADGRLPQGR